MAAGSGYVFAATGEKYAILARRAARTLRKVAPGAEIDLFVDRPVDDPIFSAVHRLEARHFRPKMEALYSSRFERTVFLDADIVAIADPGDIFDVLERFDVAAAHVNTRSFPNALRSVDRDLPNAFPAFNSGVLGIRKSPDTDALLREWERILTDRAIEIDQPILRELLFASDLRIATLPVEYNLMAYGLLEGMKSGQTAPRLLHLRHIHLKGADPGDPTKPYALKDLLPPFFRKRIADLQSCDRTLGGKLDPAIVFSPAPNAGRRARLDRFVKQPLRRILGRS